ncbi:hypothetical protein UPYG_G00317640 [Umbra pygmaea]|uniref:Protein sleepless n=1 Tax=Umbra pygmaea TaxID=75934 RepID=A0ABD0W0V0_UMBPY
MVQPLLLAHLSLQHTQVPDSLLKPRCAGCSTRLPCTFVGSMNGICAHRTVASSDVSVSIFIRERMWLLTYTTLFWVILKSGLALQIQCYQCEEAIHNECSTPEFIVNCTVNVQDMCQKEVLVKEDGKPSDLSAWGFLSVKKVGGDLHCEFANGV